MIRIIRVRWTSWQRRNRSYSSRWTQPRRKSDRTRRSSGTDAGWHCNNIIYLSANYNRFMHHACQNIVRNPWQASLSNCWPTSLIFFNAMKKFVTPSHFNVNGQHRICLIVGKFKQVWWAKSSLSENDTNIVVLPVFFSDKWITSIVSFIFFSVLWRRKKQMT